MIDASITLFNPTRIVHEWLMDISVMQMHLNIQRLHRNTRTLFATRGMPLALGEFILRRGLMGSGPYIATSGGYHVGFAPWLSFSEYWSYRGGDFGHEPSNGISSLWIKSQKTS